mmetsp:Transcript_39094/g.59619  ORF Transcript_39094/g.59619 Transcript_39094/m.59619 type:complete len:165 (+) Transcript_39094:60-554(+)|eukprot:CAMPEP_0170501228 /NCGR_PEP_ID=MMETSP0208-20121228/37627_1 /TAXON_ID=197538 /ORGANISM="Strombidium inclinatum, Strain S3" /LENGTH=164 /DNA_ID=CAMNT_0010779663 /DNA_START=59 /DNA_END=553 /DNA_ORIENTATION=+
MRLKVHDFDFAMEADITLDQNTGFLGFDVYNCKINFGGTAFEHDNWIVAIAGYFLTTYMFVIFENTTSIFGTAILTHLLGPITEEFLNGYKTEITLPSPFPGQESEATFEFDFRNTHAPLINEGDISFYLSGDLIYGMNSCVNFDKGKLIFDPTREASQILITD